MKHLYIAFLAIFAFMGQPLSGQVFVPSEWSGRIWIETDPDKVDSQLDDFTVAVILDETNFDFSQAETDGRDIRFVAPDLETLLSFERELHDASAPKAVYWVRLPVVSNVEATGFYLFFGNPAASDAAVTGAGVWSSYRAIWHMEHEEDPGEPGSYFIPDSKHENDAEKVSETSPSQVPGLTGNAQQFDGFADRISVPRVTSNNIDVSAGLTLSAWIRPEAQPFLLDEEGGAAAAYSLRKLRDGYTGNAIEVRRSSNDATENIGFEDGFLDTVALKNFVGSGDGFVVTWYDQSGNGQDVTQDVSDSQPVIVVGGAILRSDGRPMVRFSDQTLSGTVNMGSRNPDVTLNAVWQQGSDGQPEVPVFLGEPENLKGLSVGYYYEPAFGFGSQKTRLNYVRLWDDNGVDGINGFFPGIKIQTGIYDYDASGSEISIFLNGDGSSGGASAAGDLDLGTGIAVMSMTIGANKDGSDHLDGSYIAEIVIFDQALSTGDRQKFENSQLRCYGISPPVIAGRGRDKYQLEFCSGNIVGYVNSTMVSAPATIGEYQHVVLTYDQSALRLYIDGDEAASTSLTGTINTGDGSLLIGKRFTGIIDETRLANSAWAADRIKADYFSGLDEMLGYDRSWFEVEHPGPRLKDVEFNLVIKNARDGTGSLISGDFNVVVTSNQPADGEVHNSPVTFTDGSASVPVTLTELGEHNLTVEVAGILRPAVVEDVLVIEEDKSGFLLSVAPTDPQDAGSTYTLNFNQARDVTGTTLDGSYNVIITSDFEGEIFNGLRNFEEGTSFRNITLTIAGEHTITVKIQGITEAKEIFVDVLPGPLAKIGFKTEEKTIAAGETSDLITIQTQDEYGNAVENTVERTVDLSTTDITGIFRDPVLLEDPPITSLTIPENTNEVSFRYYSETAGIHILTVTDAAAVDPLDGDSQEITVTGAAPVAIVFLTEERSIAAGEMSEVITIGLEDQYGNVAESSGETVINLFSDLGGTFRDEADELDITTVTISDGESEASFRFTSTVVGAHEISAEYDAEVLQAGTQNLTVTASAPAAIVFVSEETTTVAGVSSDVIVIGLVDEFGNETESDGITIVDLSSDLDGTFRDEADEEDITQVTIPDGESQAVFRYYSEVAGVHILTVNDAAAENPLEGNTQELTVIADVPAKIVFVTGEQIVQVGELSGIITLQLNDQYGNVAVSSGITEISLGTNNSGVFMDVDDTIDISTVEIGDKESEASFLYIPSEEGVHLLLADDDTATVDPLEGDTQELLAIGTYTWGGTNQVWDEGPNWVGGVVPPANSRVRIPAGNALITNVDVTVLFLNIEDEGIVSIDSGRTLTVGNNGLILVESGGSLDAAGDIAIAGGGRLTVDPGGEIESEGDIAINEGGSAVIEVGGNVTSTGTIINSAGTGGLLVRSDNSGTGSLILSGTGVEATVQRWVKGNVWQLVSVPVSGMTIGDFLENSQTSNDEFNNIFYNSIHAYYAMTHYDEALGSNGNWADFYDTGMFGNPLEPGRSYLVRRRVDGLIAFRGVLEPGPLSVGIERVVSGWNSIGNPFSSALRVKGEDGFLQDNGVSPGVLDPYFAALYIYDPDYPNRYSVISNGNYVVTDRPEITQGYVQPGQGFLVRSKVGGGNVEFTAAMKAHQHTGVQFFKKGGDDYWPTVILTVTTDSNEAYTVITFNENMTRGLDVTYDAGLFGGDPALRLYTRLVEGGSDVNIAIQCLPDRDFEDMVIPVGIDFPDGGEIRFSTDIITLPEGASAVIEDRELDIFTDLEEEDYVVELAPGTKGTGRFFLRTDLGITSSELAEMEYFDIYSYEREVFIKGLAREGSYAVVYDILGRNIRQVKLQPVSLNSFRMDGYSRGIYLVRVYDRDSVQVKRLYID